MPHRFFNVQSPIGRWKNHLPHWQQFETIYFLTFRLADAVPASVLRQWEQEREAWLAHHTEPWSLTVQREYFNRFPRNIERWLDQGSGECILRADQVAKLVSDALLHENGKRYHQFCWVVMPNHVHAIVAPIMPATLDELVQIWKSYTAHAINKLLGRKGAVWQKDYFDRIIRDEEHLGNLVGCIRRNPVKAGLRAGEFLLWESEECRGIGNREFEGS